MSRYWIGTLFDTPIPTGLPQGVIWYKGQCEICPTTGRQHIQCVVGFARGVRLCAVKRLVGEGHWEATRSIQADAYVHKDDTAVAGTRFEFGSKAFRRNNAHDWDAIKEGAISGDYSAIPSDIFVRYYRLI